MKNFTYRSLEEKENLEVILRKRKRKINRQQIVSGCILAVVVVSILLYIAHHLFYTEFYGYMNVDVNRVRAPYDMYVDSVYVKPGKVVHKGDTLFSYYVLDWLVINANPNEEPEIRQRRRNYQLQFTNAGQKVEVLRVRIAELKKQIATEDHNIRFGLSDNSHALDLQRELKVTEAQLTAALNEQAAIGKMLRETSFADPKINSEVRGGIQIFENPAMHDSRIERRQYIASEDAFVVDVHAPSYMVFFEKEEIVSLQQLNLQANNLSVLAYVPIDKADKIQNNQKAQIIINDKHTFNAHVTIKGVRSELIPENLRSFFTRENTALIAILEIDEGQVIPFWGATNGLPVTIRLKNYRMWGEEEPHNNEMLYKVGHGVIFNSIEYYANKVAVEDSLKQAERQRKEMAADTTRRQKLECQIIGKVKAAEQMVDAPREIAADPGDYYIILNAFKSEALAKEGIALWKKSGVSPKGILNASGQWLVYLSSFSDKEIAVHQLRILTSSSRLYKDAWILHNAIK